MKGTAVREVSAQNFPGTLPAEEQLRFLVRYAVLAPSARNAQPWRFAVGEKTVRVYADSARWQPVADPDRRELYLGLGCAVENLLVAAERFGFSHQVAYFPDPHDDLLAAAASFAPGGRPAPVRAPITLEALLARRTAHGPFTGRPLTVAELRLLVECTRDDEISVTFGEGPAKRRAVRELLREATRIQLERPDYRRELGELVGRGDLGGPWPLRRLGGLALRSGTFARWLERAELAAFRSAPLLAVIGSARDDRRVQVRSGQLLERLWLAATVCGLGLQPASAIVEVNDIRTELARAFGLPDGFKVQELVRIGEPVRRFGFTTPRWPAEEVLGE